MDNLPLYIDFALPFLLFTTGVSYLFDAFKHHRRKPLPRCFKCAYDLRACNSLTCPECGFTHPNQRYLLHGTISKPRLIIALFLLSLSLIPPTAIAIQYLRNHAALRQAEAIKIQVAPALTADRTTHLVTADYSRATRWAARQAGWDHSTAFLDDFLFTRRFQRWTEPDFLFVYASSLFLSPQRHYGRRFGVAVPWRFASNPAHPSTTTQSAQLLAYAVKSPGLQSLLLQHEFPVDDQALPGLSSAPDLYSISISHCEISPTGIARLTSLKSLRNLDLTYPRAITDQDVSASLALPHLTDLTLRSLDKSSTLTSVCFPLSPSSASLKLDLQIPFHPGDDPAPFKNLPPHWHTLSLILPTIRPEQLATLPLPGPRAYLTLDFTSNTHITDADLNFLTQDPNVLQSLRLIPGPQMTAHLIQRLCGRLTGRKPVTSYGRPTGFDLDIANLPLTQKALESLAIPRCTSLILRNCALEPSALAGLSRVRSLKRLALRTILLNLADFQTLATHPGLDSLTLDTIDDPTLAALARSPHRLWVTVLKNDTTPAARSRHQHISIHQTQDLD